MREIVLDTETTGLSPERGDRIIEIGCVELLNYIPTGRVFHEYINPERDIPQEAIDIHGITNEHVADKPKFHALADKFLAFIGSDQLVIHNASFDIGFLNWELGLVDKPKISMNRVVDTLAIARRKTPSGPNNLDALCKRYNIDNSSRTVHGALLDSELLADVYIELIGKRQGNLSLDPSQASFGADDSQAAGAERPKFQRSKPLASILTDEEITAHQEFINSFPQTAIWHEYE